MDDVDAVLFDLDGTLCVHDQEPEALLSQAFERAGTEPLFGATDAAAVDTAGLPSAESDREFHRLLFQAAADRAGSSPSGDVIDAVTGAYLDLRDPTAVSLRAGAREALSAARDRGPVGLVTNGGAATQSGKLEAVGIREVFDTVVYCDPAAGVEPKPDPGPVRLALEKLGTEPARAVLVGDDLAADVGAARNAGTRSVWVPREPTEQAEPRDPEPSMVCASMRALATRF